MLNKFLIEKYVKQALEEDIGFEDITTDNLVSEDDKLECTLNTRVDGVFCGRDVFKTVFEVLDKDIDIKFFFKDGDEIKKGDVIWCPPNVKHWHGASEYSKMSHIAISPNAKDCTKPPPRRGASS